MDKIKIDRQFDAISNRLNDFATIFREGGVFANGVDANGGDSAWFSEVRKALDHAIDAVNDAHRYSMHPADVDEATEIEEESIEESTELKLLARIKHLSGL